MSEPLLAVKDLRMEYVNGSGRLSVLGGLTFQVAEGEFLCLVGPSGYGKTTLLRLLAGLERPWAGQVCLAGEVMSQPRRDVGVVFQEPTLMAWRTVEANVALPLDVKNPEGALPARKRGLRTSGRAGFFHVNEVHEKKEARQRARELLELVGLSGFEDYYPAQLSGGMAQRVALARALVHDPQLLLLDEPFGALDALTREKMGCELLRIWQAHRKTVVMVTHSVTEAVFLADRVLVLGARPAVVVAEIAVDLPRPRTEETLESPAFSAVAHRVREALDQASVPGSGSADEHC